MIRFSKYIWLYFLLSALVLVPGIYSLVRYGFKPAVDFTGGTLLELKTPSDTSDSIFQGYAKSTGVTLVSTQTAGPSTYLLRFKPASDEKINEFVGRVRTASKGKDITVLRNETVGPTLGAELLQKAVVAAVLAVMAILAYVAYAFKNVKFGVSAIVALVHDVLVVFSVFSLLGHFLNVEVDTLFVTAFLTTMSFSVHDTIVIFDRIREYRRTYRNLDIEDLSNVALTETMGRSIINSFTIIFMLLALALMGGASVQWFAVALLVGTVTGTYSSPFIATPVLLLWDRWEKRRKS